GRTTQVRHGWPLMGVVTRPSGTGLSDGSGSGAALWPANVLRSDGEPLRCPLVEPGLTGAMNRSFDIIVAGLGAVGSAAAYQLAKRGARVLGIDRFSPPHAHGSSHGETRITRLAIGEGDHYTPLAMRSHEIWREIEEATGNELLVQTGGLIISGRTNTPAMHVSGFFDNTVLAARKHGIPHELLDATSIRQSFRAFNVREDEVGYY